MRPRRSRGYEAPASSDLSERFGEKCPVCSAALGTRVSLDERSGRFVVPPCLRLEIGPMDQPRRAPWRVTAVGGSFPSAVSTTPAFVASEVDYVYLLCGDGHIFPESTPISQRDGTAGAEQGVDRWNMVAVIGASASGKTYLLLRMLNQDLDNPENWDRPDDSGRVRLHQLNPLEEIPLQRRAKQYTQTLADQLPIQPTLMENTATPEGILFDQLPHALEAILDLIRRIVVDGGRRAERWGKGFRQPLVVRTDSRAASFSRRQLTWTGIADLPGELFQADPVNPRERAKLRAYDALIWVIDPAVASYALDRLAKDVLGGEIDYEGVLDGSLRPGSTAQLGQRTVRAVRDQIQLDIGQSLTLVGNEYAADHGSALQMLVAVNKCDLIYAALSKGKKLDELDVPGVVERGVFGYLAATVNRWAEGHLTADASSEALLSYLHGATSAVPEVRRQRTEQVARGLLKHYSAAEAFWSLVHRGTPDDIRIDAGATMALPRQRIKLPSVGAHLDEALVPGSDRRILVRDLVMSAVGCGIACGLGHESAIYKILREPWQNLRVFLCSPLGTVPVAREQPGDDEDPVHLLEPLDPEATFPPAKQRSAALTQLLLAVLGKARALPGVPE